MTESNWAMFMAVNHVAIQVLIAGIFLGIALNRIAKAIEELKK